MERQVEALLKGRRFRQLLDNYIGELKEKYALKTAEIEVLYYLSRGGARNAAKDIASSLQMNKGHISSTMESLCQRGYVTASKDSRDYRVIHYTLTEAAASMTKEIDLAVGRLYQTMFAGISPEDQAALKRVAAQMSDNIRRILGEAK